jgi:hypothetical protein
MDKKKLLYIGLGALALLVIYSSLKKEALKEISEKREEDKKTFDATKLPESLKPPYKMMEGEVIKPTRPIKKSLIGLSLKPRFDR